jgi:hypothetical protein
MQRMVRRTSGMPVEWLASVRNLQCGEDML